MRTSFGHTIQAPRQLACLTGVFVERLWKESKSLVDTEKSSWQKLLAEFEEEGYADLSINGHELAKHGGVEGGAPSFYSTQILYPPKAGEILFETIPPRSFSRCSVTIKQFQDTMFQYGPPTQRDWHAYR